MVTIGLGGEEINNSKIKIQNKKEKASTFSFLFS